MHYLLFLFCLAAACGQGQTQSAATAPAAEKKTETFRIAFGSCAHQDHPQPILDKIVAQNPQLFIYLGDNIYGDSRRPDTLRAKYARLGAKPGFQRLRGACKVCAVWDDHDYGENDAGKYYPLKKESKDIFLDFWQEPENSERRLHEGIYHSFFTGPNNQVQVILLDTRTFRSNLLPNDGSAGRKNDYRPHVSCDSTMLGGKQWRWLEDQLKKDAKLRIIATSTQFAHAYNGYESWTNFPCEQRQMLLLIRGMKANGVVFISGDVHWGEISKRETNGLYPIYDVTSSGLTQTWDGTEPNEFRVGEAVPENNFGLIEIEMKDGGDWLLHMKLIDVNGTVRVKETVPVKKLQF